jgi:hypothetical protein
MAVSYRRLAFFLQGRPNGPDRVHDCRRPSQPRILGPSLTHVFPDKSCFPACGEEKFLTADGRGRLPDDESGKKEKKLLVLCRYHLRWPARVCGRRPSLNDPPAVGRAL